MDPKRGRWRLLGALGVLVATVSSGQGQSNNGATAGFYAQVPAQHVVSEPAGASRCQFCHPSQVEGYARSTMAHSLRRAAQEPGGRSIHPTKRSRCIRRRLAIGSAWRVAEMNEPPHRSRDWFRQLCLRLPARPGGPSVPIPGCVLHESTYL
jgi:hypothetical protein